MALTYEQRMQAAHKKDSPEAAKAEVDEWCKLFPDYRNIVEGIRDELRHRDTRRQQSDRYETPSFKQATLEF